MPNFQLNITRDYNCLWLWRLMVETIWSRCKYQGMSILWCYNYNWYDYICDWIIRVELDIHIVNKLIVVPNMNQRPSDPSTTPTIHQLQLAWCTSTFSNVINSLLGIIKANIKKILLVTNKGENYNLIK
jgi:hypothetical protein